MRPADAFALPLSCHQTASGAVSFGFVPIPVQIEFSMAKGRLKSIRPHVANTFQTAFYRQITAAFICPMRPILRLSRLLPAECRQL